MSENVAETSNASPVVEKDRDSRDTSLNQYNWHNYNYWLSVQQLYYQHYYTMCYLYYVYSWPLFTQQSQTNHQQWLYEQNHSANAASTQLEANVQQRSATSSQQQVAEQRDGLTNNQRPPVIQQTHPQQVRRAGCEARVASIQKRIFAELIDFVFMYFTKFVTFSIFYNNTEYFSQLQYSFIIDENTSITDLEHLLIQALVYRIMVFLYEVFFLTGGLYGSTGGATPGKFLMGLTVVAGDHIETLEFFPGSEDKIRIFPGGTLGLWRSCCRALVKNFSMTILFPVFLTILFFPHNRTIYDVIAGSVVVVNIPQGNQQHHQD